MEVASEQEEMDPLLDCCKRFDLAVFIRINVMHTNYMATNDTNDI